MLIIPEQNIIAILPPRTGSTTLHNAVREACPASFMLYRHAERDAIPPGYESMKVMAFVRHPLARMWSLYKFLCQLDPLTSATWAQESVMDLLESVQGKTFEDWLLHNEHLLLPQHTGHPGLHQTHYMPENTKSQWHYARPELGTTVLHFADMPRLLEEWGMPALHLNKTTRRLTMPKLEGKVLEHLETFMGWELGLGLDLI